MKVWLSVEQEIVIVTEEAAFFNFFLQRESFFSRKFF